MNYKHIILLTLSISSAVSFAQSPLGTVPPTARPQTPPSVAQPAPEQQAPAAALRTTATKATPELAGKIMSFEFTGAPLEVVMEDYCRWTGKIYLKTDAVNASITLKAEKITTEEGIKIVEAILAMNNVALVPLDDKYVKVVLATAGDLTGQGLNINLDPEEELGNSDRFVTKIIRLKNVEIQEVQAAVQHVIHAYGKIMGLQRSNSLMITDTEANVKRALEIIKFIDQGSATVESRIYEIQYAEASEIAAKLKEIVEAAQADQKTVPTPQTSAVRTPPGVIRATAQQRAAAVPKQASIGQTEGAAAATIITGTVKILSDERTNIIIIFSQEENFTYFDRIIKVLDVEVEPAVNFEVVNLEYADAVELSGTLNDLVGAATGGSSRSSSSSRTSSNSSSASRTSSSRDTGTSTVTPNAVTTGAINNLSKLSENTKILADERTNSIILMGEKSDIAAIKVVIKHLDIMLEQVIIEAAIFEIGLSDSLRHGIDWLYQSQGGNKIGGWDGNNLLNSTNGIGTVAASALTYYQNITGINTEMAINLAATDNDAKLVSTPVIMTTDNTEATLSIGEQRPVVTSTSSYANSSGTQSSTYEYKDIGIQLTVTPRINPQRFVVMELTQKADQLGGSVTIDNNDVPIILNREFGAQIAVPDGGTVVLGGLVNTEWEDNVTKIPLLGDIPLIGRYLFSSVSKEEVQRELIVLMSPYVMTNMEEMRNQTERLYQGTNLRQDDWDNNWSQSPLRYLPDPVEIKDGEQAEKQQVPKEPAPSHDQVMQMLDSMDQPVE